MSQSKQPLVTDFKSLIKSASEKPAPIVIGEKQDAVERHEIRAAEPEKPSAPQAKQRSKPEQKKGQGSAPAKESYPWDDANPKVMKFVQVRMPEDLHAKLAWIKANSIGVPSVHDLMLSAITADADSRIARIKKGDRGG